MPVALGSLGALGLARAGFLALPQDIAFPARTATAQYLYAVGILALVSILLCLARAGRPTRPAVAGFAVLALGQGAWVGWALTDALPWLLLANGAFVAGLALFVAAVRSRGGVEGAD